MSVQAAQERRVLKVAEVALVLGLHEATIRRLVHAGELRAIRVGGQYLIHRDVLEELLAGGGASPNTDV